MKLLNDNSGQEDELSENFEIKARNTTTSLLESWSMKSINTDYFITILYLKPLAEQELVTNIFCEPKDYLFVTS